MSVCGLIDVSGLQTPSWADFFCHGGPPLGPLQEDSGEALGPGSGSAPTGRPAAQAEPSKPGPDGVPSITRMCELMNVVTSALSAL